MNNSDIAELLAVAYASHCAECEVLGKNPVSCAFFYEKYQKNIQDFRHLLSVDVGSRELNG